MNTRTLIGAAFGAALALLPTFADAQKLPNTDTGLYRNVGNWQVRVDENMGYGCFVMASYQNGSVIRIGFDNRQTTPTAYMLLGNSSWSSIVVGQPYTLTFTFDTASVFTWHASAIDMHGTTMLDFRFTDVAFLTAIAAHQSINVAYQGKFVTRMNLPGSSAAMATMAECQRQFGIGHAAPGDPFQSSGTADPFHQ